MSIYKWDRKILFQFIELKRIHMGFYHPSVEKLFDLTKRANQSDATKDTVDLLDKLSNM